MHTHRVFSNVEAYSKEKILPNCILTGLKDLVHVIKQNM